MARLTGKARRVSAPNIANAISSSPESADINPTVVIDLIDEEEEETNQSQPTSTYSPRDQPFAPLTLPHVAIENAANN